MIIQNTQPNLFPQEKSTPKRIQGGVTTSDLVMSAYIDGNENVFPHVLDLHVPKGSKIADVTWGRGVFWKKVPKDDYDVIGTDIAMGVDCRNLPYENASLDCVVLDPPYMEGFYRKNNDQKAGSGCIRGLLKPILMVMK